MGNTNMENDSKMTGSIRNCSWGYKCEKTWDDLLALDVDRTDHRYCDACEKNVHLCKTADELSTSVLLNRCVAFHPKLVDQLGALAATSELEDINRSNAKDFDPLEPLSIGEIQAPYYTK